MKSHCDFCGKDFDVVFSDEPQQEGGIKILFICSRCQHRYEVAYLTPRAMALRDELHDAVVKYGAKDRRVRRLRERYQRSYVGLSERG